MQYVRVSLVTPKAGHRDEVMRIEEQLIAYFLSQPGFQEAYRLTSPDRVGRVSVWDSQTDADNAATSQHVLSLRSQMLPMITDAIETGMDGERVGR